MALKADTADPQQQSGQGMVLAFIQRKTIQNLEASLSHKENLLVEMVLGTILGSRRRKKQKLFKKNLHSKS